MVENLGQALLVFDVVGMTLDEPEQNVAGLVEILQAFFWLLVVGKADRQFRVTLGEGGLKPRIARVLGCERSYDPQRVTLPVHGFGKVVRYSELAHGEVAIGHPALELRVVGDVPGQRLPELERRAIVVDRVLR